MKARLLLAALLIQTTLLGCGTPSETDDFSGLLGKPAKITIYHENKAYTVSSEQPMFTDLVKTTEKALEETDDIYKGIDETNRFLESGEALLIELEESKMLSFGIMKEDDKLRVKRVAVPLAGEYYDSSNMIMAGGESTLGMFRTEKGLLRDLKGLAEEVVEKNK